MLYPNETLPDVDLMRQAVSEMLTIDLQRLQFDFEGRGYSRDVFRVIGQDASGQEYRLLLKGLSDLTPYHLYHDVLVPYELNSPRMFGTFDRGDAHYVLMEYIPHEPPDWVDIDKYRMAIDWLARKDHVAERHWDRIAALPYLEPFDMGTFESRLPAMRRACDDRVDPLICASLLDVLESNRRRFDKAAECIRRGPQTVTHNDFQMLNILFGTGPKRGRMYVIDWTHPALGSVAVDLATLIHVAPPRHRAELIGRYLEARPVPDFDCIFPAAQLHVHLSILNWMIDALRSGLDHAVHRPRLEELIGQVMEYFQT